MPLATKATAVSGPSSGAMPAATEGSAGTLVQTRTASCGPSSAGSAAARGRHSMTPSAAVRTTSPRARIASSCAPRATAETSAPPFASRAARSPPIAPAP